MTEIYDCVNCSNQTQRFYSFWKGRLLAEKEQYVNPNVSTAKTTYEIYGCCQTSLCENCVKSHVKQDAKSEMRIFGLISLFATFPIWGSLIYLVISEYEDWVFAILLILGIFSLSGPLIFVAALWKLFKLSRGIVDWKSNGYELAVELDKKRGLGSYCGKTGDDIVYWTEEKYREKFSE